MKAPPVTTTMMRKMGKTVVRRRSPRAISLWILIEYSLQGETGHCVARWLRGAVQDWLPRLLGVGGRTHMCYPGIVFKSTVDSLFGFVNHAMSTSCLENAYASLGSTTLQFRRCDIAKALVSSVSCTSTMESRAAGVYR